MEDESEILAYIEKDDAEFRNHWVFRELNCTPEELFESAREFSKAHGIEIPKSQKLQRIPRLNPVSQLNFNRLTVLRA